MNNIRREILKLLNGKLKRLINENLRSKLIDILEKADEHEFTEQINTSLEVLKKFNPKRLIDREKLSRQSKDLLKYLTDSNAGENSIEDILIKLELLIFPLLDYTTTSSENLMLEAPLTPSIDDQRQELLSELMDAPLDDIANYLEENTDKKFDWFYEFDIINEVLFRLRNPRIFHEQSNEPIDSLYEYIKNTVTHSYGLDGRRLAQLFADQYGYIGSDTMRKHLEEFVENRPECSEYTLNSFFQSNPCLEHIFNSKDKKQFKKLFQIYCNKLATKTLPVPIKYKLNDAHVNTKRVPDHQRQTSVQKDEHKDTIRSLPLKNEPINKPNSLNCLTTKNLRATDSQSMTSNTTKKCSSMEPTREMLESSLSHPENRQIMPNENSIMHPTVSNDLQTSATGMNKKKVGIKRKNSETFDSETAVVYSRSIAIKRGKRCSSVVSTSTDDSF